MLGPVYSIVLALAPLGFAIWLWRWLTKTSPLSLRVAAGASAGGATVAGVAVYLERLVLDWTGLSLEVAQTGQLGALAAMFLLCAPLEEGLKVLVVWPIYHWHYMTRPRLGLAYAVYAAAGFAAVESVALLFLEAAELQNFFRGLLALPAHLFFAGVWGYALGKGRSGRSTWFATAWFLSMLLHALYDHVIFGRGPGLWVAIVPLLILMGLGAWLVLRDAAPESESPASGAEPLSLRDVREALRRTDRPLMLHWIVIGALVTLGVMIACIAVAVYLGHRLGIDFAMADEADVRSSGPLVLLGVAILAAFPMAGYLIARASSAHSVLEPAMAAALAIAAIVFMLSITAPVGIVFALAVAPVAFALACGGAWFALER